jgi:hypothetical protein
LSLALSSFVNLPWPQLAAFMGFLISVVTFIGMAGVMFHRFRLWMGDHVQEILGISDLREDLREHSQKLDAAIETLTNLQTAQLEIAHLKEEVMALKVETTALKQYIEAHA